MNSKRLISLLLTPLMLMPGMAVAEAAQPTWTIGFSAQEILPDMARLRNKEYYIAGYNSGYPATDMLDPQYARAVWLDDGSGAGGVVMVAIDCVAISSVDVDKIRNRLTDFMKDTGCRYVHVCATHTHAGIDTMGLWGPLGVSGIDEDFMNTLYEQTEKAVRECYETRKQGRLYYGTAELPETLLRDSRLPNVMDTTLTCLRFAPSDGGKGLRIYHFPAHAEALRSKNSLVSADYPGVLGRIVSETTGDDFAYFTGAIGGLIMTQLLNEDVYKSLEETGKILAEAALSIDNEEELAPSLVHEVMEMTVPLNNTAFLQMQFLGVLRSDAVKCKSETGMGIRTQMTYLKIGNLPLILTPGELFPELALGYDPSFKGDNPDGVNPKSYTEILGTDRFLVIGLADDEIGYIVPPEDYYLDPDAPYLKKAYKDGRRHYEETNSASIHSAPVIAETLEKLYNKAEGSTK